MNQVLVIGKLVELSKNSERSGNYLAKISVPIPVYAQNKNTEFALLNFELPQSLYEKLDEWAHLNDTMGIRGHLTSRNKKVVLVAEKVTFLSTMSKRK